MTEHDAQPTAQRDPAFSETQGEPQETHNEARQDQPQEARAEAGQENGAEVSTDATAAGVPEAASPELVIISGMSGAGRSTAA